VFKTFTDAKAGAWTSGVSVLGLKEDGVGYAVDQFNKSLITPDMKAAADAAAANIVAGKIEVHDYMSDSKCPM
jgi:basic membrane protein A